MFADLLARLRPGPPPKAREVNPADVRKLLAQRERQQRKLAAEQATLAAIETEMVALLDGAEEATDAVGRVLFTYRPDGTFAPRRFADDHPGIAAEFNRMIPALDVAALTAAHPVLARKYRARVLRVRSGV